MKRKKLKTYKKTQRKKSVIIPCSYFDQQSVITLKKIKHRVKNSKNKHRKKQWRLQGFFKIDAEISNISDINNLVVFPVKKKSKRAGKRIQKKKLYLRSYNNRNTRTRDIEILSEKLVASAEQQIDPEYLKSIHEILVIDENGVWTSIEDQNYIIEEEFDPYYTGVFKDNQIPDFHYRLEKRHNKLKKKINDKNKNKKIDADNNEDKNTKLNVDYNEYKIKKIDELNNEDKNKKLDADDLEIENEEENEEEEDEEDDDDEFENDEEEDFEIDEQLEEDLNDHEFLEFAETQDNFEDYDYDNYNYYDDYDEY